LEQYPTGKRISLIYDRSLPDGPLRQGEILSNVIQLKLDLSTIDDEDKRFDPIVHPYAVIVSQDCDLDWDFKAREGGAKEHKKNPERIVM
jgi:hypothetical protein